MAVKQNKLGEYELAEIKDLYTGARCEVRYFARIFKVSSIWMEWVLDYNGARERTGAQHRAWHRRNKKQVAARMKEYMKTYTPKPLSPEALKRKIMRGRISYRKNREHYLAYFKKYAQEHREEINARHRRQYQRKKKEKEVLNNE